MSLAFTSLPLLGVGFAYVVALLLLGVGSSLRRNWKQVSRLALFSFLFARFVQGMSLAFISDVGWSLRRAGRGKKKIIHNL
jgi:hypothetical protein